LTHIERGFVSSFNSARDIAFELGVDQSFPVKRCASRTKQFDELNATEESIAPSPPARSPRERLYLILFIPKLGSKRGNWNLGHKEKKILSHHLTV
jgi:hypothetical protein